MITLSSACKIKDSTQDALKDAMLTYLYNQVNNDSSKVKYRIEDVEFFDDKDKSRYVCEFMVNMREFSIEGKARFDTTGKMKAYISNNFQRVTRLY